MYSGDEFYDEGYEDPTPDYEVFERNQLYADMDAGEGRDHYIDEEEEEYEEPYSQGDGVMYEDAYLDSYMEDRIGGGDYAYCD